MPSPPLVFHHLSTSPDGDDSPIEPDFSSPPILRAHAQPLRPTPHSVTSETSSRTPSSTRPIPEDAGRRAKSFSPHAGDLLGGSSESAPNRVRDTRHSVNSILIDSQPRRERRLHLSNLLGRHGSDGPGGDVPSSNFYSDAHTPLWPHRAEGDPMGPYIARPLPPQVIRPRIDREPEPPHLADFGRRSQGSFNELGLPSVGFTPTAFRPRPEFAQQMDFPTPEPPAAERESQSPPAVPLLHPQRPSAMPIRITSPLSTSTSSEDEIDPRILLAYGLTGNHLDSAARDSSPTLPTVPPPRVSTPPSLFRRQLAHGSRDQIDFSPPRLGGRSREPSSGRHQDLDRPEELEIRSRVLQERLSRPDALRTQGERYDPSPQWSGRIPWAFGGSIVPPQSNIRNQSSDTASRTGRYNLDDDLRSRPRRRLSITETDTQGGDIDRWNRHVQDAVSRRAHIDQAPVQNSMSRRSREGSAPYQIRPRVNRPQEEMSMEPYSQPAALWGEIPLDEEERPINTIFGWREMSSMTDPLARYSRYQRSSGDTDPLYGVRRPDPQTTFQGSWLGRHYPFATTNPFIPTVAIDGEDYPPSLANVLNHIRLKPDMTVMEKARIVKLITRTVGLWPSKIRQNAAEKMVDVEDWGTMTVREGMEKDICCSVCHDEYEEDSQVTITPCKHMYHKGCLETWIQTPNTSTCPMCRRDLAVLACMTKMTAENKKEDVLPLWMSM